MAPRRRDAGVGRSQAETPGPTIAALADDLLACCLAPLSQGERLQHAALVSKRFRAACLAPQLLHSIIVRSAGGQALLPRLASLLTFLMAQAAHVRKLKLEVPLPEDPALSDAQLQELAVLVGGCLSACGTAGCLEQLTVDRAVPLPSVAWLPGLTALQQLELGSSREPLQLPPGFSQLQALSDATLAGSPLQLEGPLPGGLTRLSLTDRESRQLPPQVLHLSKLAHLELWYADFEAASLAPLSSLASLQRLSLICCAGLPSGLSTLTRLDSLVLDSSDRDGDSATLAAALPHLSQLTCLAMVTDQLESIPPSITRLTQLQRLYAYSYDAPADLPLPSGAWLASLRWLGLPWPALQASVGVLAAALRLEYLSSLSLPECEEDEEGDGGSGTVRWEACWDFIATHPPLRCLGIECGGAEVTLALVDALLDIRHRRPALLVQRTDRPGRSRFWNELLNCTDIPTRPG